MNAQGHEVLHRPIAAGRIRLTGDAPIPLNPPTGCRFRTRCWKAQDRCATEEPALEPRDDGNQRTACHYPETGALSQVTNAGTGNESAGDARS